METQRDGEWMKTQGDGEWLGTQGDGELTLTVTLVPSSLKNLAAIELYSFVVSVFV